LERQRKEKKKERVSERELNSNAAKRGSQFNSNAAKEKGSQFNSNAAKGKGSQFNRNTVKLRKVSFVWFLTRWSRPTFSVSHTDSFEPN
jgi:hypothetical protein